VNNRSNPLGISLIAWITLIILAVIVIYSFAQSQDYRILAFGLPMLVLLAIIPMVLRRMSQKTYSDATPLYESEARFYKISKIDLSKVGDTVKVRGMIEKVSFRWLNRPRLNINDGTGTISAILFTPPQENLTVGEQVEVLGTVSRGLTRRKSPAISAIAVKKLDT
jgi:hypothetical protein